MHNILKLILVGAVALSSSSSVTSTQLLKTSSTWNGAAIQYSASKKPEVQAVMVEIAEGGSTVWHQHPVNNFAFVLDGTVRLELEDGTTRRFKAGDAFAEVVSTWHRGVNEGSGPVKILVWYTGEAGGPISVARAETK